MNDIVKYYVDIINDKILILNQLIKHSFGMGLTVYNM